MKVFTFVVGAKANGIIECNVPYSHHDKFESGIEAVMIFSETGQIKAFFYKEDLIGYYIREIDCEEGDE